MSGAAREIRTRRRVQKKATAQAVKQARNEPTWEAFEKAQVKVTRASSTPSSSSATIVASSSARVITPKAVSLSYSEKNGQKLAQPIDERLLTCETCVPNRVCFSFAARLQHQLVVHAREWLQCSICRTQEDVQPYESNKRLFCLPPPKSLASHTAECTVSESMLKQVCHKPCRNLPSFRSHQQGVGHGWYFARCRVLLLLLEAIRIVPLEVIVSIVLPYLELICCDTCTRAARCCQEIPSKSQGEER